RKRARYQVMSTTASAVVTALTYGALAYLVIEHRIGVAEAGAAVVASQQLNGQLSGIMQNATQLYESSLFLEDWDEFSALAPTRDPGWVFQRVAVLFQDFARFMLTARENIGLGRVENIGDEGAIVDSARRAGADGFVEAWPDRYSTVLGPVFMGGREVSIGQW